MFEITLLKRISIILLITTVFITESSGQDEKKWVEIHGFVNHELIYDTRVSTAAREGEVYLFPKPAAYDRFGKDINDKGKLQMFTFHTRMKTVINGPDLKNFKSSGLIEFDFLGTNDATVNLIRLRHAFIKLKSEKVELLFGQYWHPMFVTECFPEVISWGASVPAHPLSRNPQVRFTYKPSPKISLSTSILSQRDFLSSGPGGNSSEYLKNSEIPELQFQLITKPSDLITVGITAGYKTIVPRLVTDSNYFSKESLGSYNLNLFAKLKTEKINLKIQGIYGQNLNSILLLGGYAVSKIDPQYDQREYINLHTFSFWTEMVYKISNLSLGIYGSYTKNLGALSDLEQVYDNHVYGLGTDINYLYRVAPRIAYTIKKMKFAFEMYTTAASFGERDLDLSIINDKEVTNHRFLFSTTLSF